MGTAVVALLFIWLVAITILLLYQFLSLRSLFKGRNRGIHEKIQEVFGSHEKMRAELQKQKQELTEEIERSSGHFSNVGIIRFNPFERIGGEQSYCIALLNTKGSGLVMTFLYTRDGVRVYCKDVEKGKGKEGDLSQEEKKAIVKAGIV